MLQRPRKTASLSGSRLRKHKLLELLKQNDFDQIYDWATRDDKLLRPASTLIFHGDPLICWRAVKALGIVGGEAGKHDLERIRLLVRNQFWHMNDESGNVGWYAPQAIAELCVNVPQLIDEYGHRLPTFFIEEPFEIGAHWGVARIAESRPDVYTTYRSQIVRSLSESVPAIRYHALRALSLVDAEEAKQQATALVDDDAEVQVFEIDSGEFFKTSVAELANRL